MVNQLPLRFNDPKFQRFDVQTFRPSDVSTFRRLPHPLSPIAQTTPLCLIYIVAVLSSPFCVRGIAISSRLGGRYE
jgi:hypothetical protein